MQIIGHRNPALTVCQKFFIEKSLELLNLGAMDSYRVRLHNSRTILEELKYCLREFDKGRIKHFHTLKSEDKSKGSLITEVSKLMELVPNYLEFRTISKKYFQQLLLQTNKDNYKKLSSATAVLLAENTSYFESIIDGTLNLIRTNDDSIDGLRHIDISLDFLFSEAINRGFSKGFLNRYIYSVFVKGMSPAASFEAAYTAFKNRLLVNHDHYDIVFRVDTTPKVCDSISANPNPRFIITDEAGEYPLVGKALAEYINFNQTAPRRRKFITHKIAAPDYFSAIKKARIAFAEYLDVLNLGLAGESLLVHSRVLAVFSPSPSSGRFQNNIESLDGKYRVEKEYYDKFSEKLPVILNNSLVQAESKEKVKSATRYLRLGNQSTEIEHKFINYWIGLEYLFSNYESASTIDRIKLHFINAHSLAYVKRNAYAFKRSVDVLSGDEKGLLPSYTSSSYDCLEIESFYSDVSLNLKTSHPLLAYRAMRLREWFFKTPARPNAADYIKKHQSNLETHFTRIYRLRNEIIHDAATNTNNDHIASNLRYYLTFALNEIIGYLSCDLLRETSIEDYFIENEIKLGNIEHDGYSLEPLLRVSNAIDFLHQDT